MTMNISYYTIDDLKLPAKRPLRKGWIMERFPTLEAALERYRVLPASGIKALGLTDGTHVLELVKCLPLFPDDKEGESVLASDYRQLPLWSSVPEAASATDACVDTLHLRYAVTGFVITPIPSPAGLPEALQGNFLWLNLGGEAQSAIRQVYVAGTGWVSPGVLSRKTEPMPLVLKYRADGVTWEGAYLPLEVAPWEYDLLLQRTLERLKNQVRRSDR